MALALVMLLGARAALAAPGVRLLYQRGSDSMDCPDEPAVREAVTAQLGYDPFGDGPLTVTTILERLGGQLTARIELSDEDGASLGTRSLSGGDCSELAPAVELVLGLAVDPLRARAATAAARQEKTDPWTGTKMPDHTGGESELPDAPRPVLKRRRSWKQGLPDGLSIGAGIAGAFNAAPSSAFGFTFALALTRLHWSFGLEVRGDLPADAAAAFAGRVETALIIGQAVPCLRHKIASVCALAAIGAERGDGRGYSDPRTVTGFYAALGGRLAVDLPLIAPVAARIYADLLAPLTRTELYAGSLGDLGHLIYRTPALSSALGLVLMAHFP